MNHLVIGIGLVVLAVGLVFFGMPNKAGQHPRLLQFEPALVLYPPVILVFLALGAAEIITAVFGISR